MSAPSVAEHRAVDAPDTRGVLRHDAAVLVVALSVLAALTLIGVVANNVQWPTDSDELAWQRLVDIWQHHGHGTAWVSPDVFITRYPLYAVFAAFGITARRGVVLASVLLNLGAGLAFVAGLLRSGG